MSPAAERNKKPILEILKPLMQMQKPETVLEIGSRFGQHALYFSEHLPETHWLPTDVPENLDDLNHALKSSSSQILKPMPLNVTNPSHWESVFQQQSPKWIYTANTFHIMPWSAVKNFWEALKPKSEVEGVFVYGPFIDASVETAPSNLEFDQSLKSTIPGAGLRNLAEVKEQAKAAGFQLTESHFMPANNRILVFCRP